jgi:xanthine dehydrogenase accessory factor
MIEMWKHALESVRGGQHTVLVVVVEAAGSVPGTPGAKIVVSGSGDVGTIGGGIAERELVDLARTHHGPPLLVPFVHSEESGSVCAGSQSFAVHELTSDDATALAELLATLESSSGNGMLTLSPDGLAFATGESGSARFLRETDAWSYREPLGLLDTLTVVGGGHVSLALSRVMATLPFRISILDNRTGVPTMTANRWAHQLDTIDYERVADHVPDGERSWVVIMTHGHAHDEDVLEALLGRTYRYLGMLGSAAKVAHIFDRLAERGASRGHLEQVRAPVGLPIRSHTPEEIAISIAGEFVQLRNAE